MSLPQLRPSPLRRWKARPADGRGLSNSVQWAVLFPLIMLSTLGIIQAGVWVHGHNVAVAATDAATDIARGSAVDGTTDGAASAAAERIATSGGLTDLSVTVDRGATRVTVTVTGRIPLFIDVGGLGTVRQVGYAPVERVTTP